MWSRVHLRMMRVVSSSLDTSAAIRCSSWKKLLMSYCFLDRHHSVRVNWASASPLKVISSVLSTRRILSLTRSTALVVGLSWIAWRILYSHLSSLTSNGRPYHCLTVLLHRIRSVLRLKVWWCSLVLSLRLILLLSVLLLLLCLIVTVPLSVLSLWHHLLSWRVLLMMSRTKIITCLLSIPSVCLLS